MDFGLSAKNFKSICLGLEPGSEFIAVVKGEEVILRKRKTITNLLEEEAIATVSEKEVKKELLERLLRQRLKV